MKMKLLCGALLGILGVAQTAAAEDQLDDRWYFTAGVGYDMLDSERNVDNDWSAHLGFGRSASPDAITCGMRATPGGRTLPSVPA